MSIEPIATGEIQPEATLEDCKSALHQVERNAAIQQGVILRHVRDHRLHIEGGYSTFEECVEREFGYERTWAYRRIDLAETVAALPIGNITNEGQARAIKPSLNGTDFYTGTVDYAAALASGEPLPELSGKGPFPGLGWYHLATVPTECVGMSWPCRLFEVEPVGDVLMASAHPHKIGATAVRVLREIEAHRVFGPQGVQVAALIGRCGTLTADDVRRLGAAWDTIWDTTPGATRDAAWGAAWDATRATRATRGTAWGAARDAAWKAAWGAIRDDWGAIRDAWDTTRDAARGLLLRDLIGQHPGWDQDAYDLLTGPWRDAIGPIHPDDAPMAGSS